MALVQSPSQNMVASLDYRFRDLSTVDAEDEDIVFGVLSAVMAELPTHVRTKAYDDVIRTEGWCVRKALAKLSRVDLVGMGMPGGHAMQVRDILFPEAEQFAPPPAQSAVAIGRTIPAPAFPAVGKTGRPTASALKAWMPGVYTTLKERGVSTT